MDYRNMIFHYFYKLHQGIQILSLVLKLQLRRWVFPNFHYSLFIVGTQFQAHEWYVGTMVAGSLLITSLNKYLCW